MAGWPSIENALRFVRELVRRHWRRALLWRGQLRVSEEALHLVLGAVIGAIGAAASVSYFLVSQGIRKLLFHTMADSGGVVPTDPAEIAARLAPLARVAIPVIGGVAAGLVLYFGLRLLGNPGLSNLLEVVVASDGRMRFRPAMLNALSSLMSISTGASVGREGLIIQLSSTLASKLGQWGRSPPYRLRLMVACGAAAGIAAGCNAPIAGAVFAAQIVLGNFSMNLFAPLVVSSVVAAIVPRTFFGTGHWFDAPSFNFTKLVELPWFPLLGVLAGVAGASMLKVLAQVQDWSNRLPLPLYLRLGLAGLAVGLIALLVPEVWGNGFAPTNRLLHEEQSILFLLSLFAAKFIATTLTVGAGTVGGVFTPTLFLGAALGGLFGALLRLGGWGEDMPAGCFALVGMGAMLAATTHSPLLAIIMLFELSLNYSLMPPLMLACAVSTLVARRLHRESIYTEPLRRKGLELDRESPQQGAATERTVGDLMREPVPPLRDNATFREIADRFLTATNNFLPVVDREQRLLGVVALQDMKMWLTAENELSSIIASDVMRPPPLFLTPAQRLSEALPVLLESELRNIPVVNNPLDLRLVGAVARAEALGLMSEAISARTM